MNDKKPFLVLFPGGWGNRTPELVEWWFRHVISHFSDHYQIVTITYAGKNMDEYIHHSLDQLKEIPDGSRVICYSMGTQIARGVAQKRPKLFRKAVFISGLETFGIRLAVLFAGVCIGIIPFLRTLFGQPLTFDTIEQCRRIFFTGKDEHTPDASIQKFMSQRIVPEPARVVLRLALPFLRKRMKPLPCPVLAIVPKNDFFVQNAQYPGESIKRIDIPGNHALLCYKENRLKNELDRIGLWLEN
ncbi:hypothetical protein HYV70_04785 [Candidatus Uhrbacteria bacterium]|nr:hypothetical protein [Candidatus Uhrbacteria bacterium]